jgi:hypothetical protein
MAKQAGIKVAHPPMAKPARKKFAQAHLWLNLQAKKLHMLTYG